MSIRRNLRDSFNKTVEDGSEDATHGQNSGAVPISLPASGSVPAALTRSGSSTLKRTSVALSSSNSSNKTTGDRTILVESGKHPLKQSLRLSSSQNILRRSSGVEALRIDGSSDVVEPFGGMTLDSELQMNPSILHGKTVGGLTYYVTNTTNPPDRVHLRLVVKAGSNHEAEDEHGLAHLIEHLAFRAHTMGLTPQQLAPRQNAADEFLSKIGAMLGPDSNACTTYDRTFYDVSIPLSQEMDSASLLTEGLGLLSNFAMRVSFPDALVEKEKLIVLEEWRLDQDKDSKSHSHRQTEILGFRSPIGTEASIKSLTAEKCKKFYKKWYRLSQMAIVVVGAVGDTAAVLPMIEAAFGHHAYGHDAPLSPEDSLVVQPERPATGPRFFSNVDASSHRQPQAGLTFTWKAKRPHFLDTRVRNWIPEYYTALLSGLLTEITQDLNRRYADEVIDISHITLELNGFDVIDFAIACHPGKEESVCIAFLTEIERLRRVEVLKSDVDSIKAANMARCTLDTIKQTEETTSFVIDRIAMHFANGTEALETAEDSLNVLAIIADSISPTSFKEFAFRTLDLSSVLAYYRYVGTSQPANAPDETSLQNWIASASATMLEQKEYLPKLSILDPSKLPPPGISLMLEPQAGAIQDTYVAENGATLYLKHTKHRRADEEGSIPLGTTVSMGTFYGYMEVAMRHPGKVLSAIAAVSYVSAHFFGLDLSQAGTRTRAVLKVFSLEASTSMFSFDVLSDGMENVWAIFHKLATQPIEFDEAAWNQYIASISSLYATEDKSPLLESIIAENETCFGTTELLNVFKPEAFLEIDLDWVRSWWPTLLTNPAWWAFEVIGDLEGDKKSQVVDCFNRFIACLPKQPDSDLGTVAERWLQPTVYFQELLTFPPGIESKTIYRGMETQAIVSFTFPSPSCLTDLDLAVQWLVNTFVYQKLMRVLRYQESAIYSIDVVRNAPFGETLPSLNHLRFFCDPDKVDALIDLTIKSLKQTYYRRMETHEVKQMMRLLRNGQDSLPAAERLLLEPGTWPETLFGSIRLKKAANKTISELVTASVFHSAFKRLFDVRNFRLIVLLPEEYEHDPKEQKNAKRRRTKPLIVGPNIIDENGTKVRTRDDESSILSKIRAILDENDPHTNNSSPTPAVLIGGAISIACVVAVSTFFFMRWRREN